ncbi:MAG: hypothetical protein K6B71_03470 [Alphaproteobacteria bacterium]|nr:hypothetical protein [Alphaproteobacteria bacterium]
MVTTFAMLYVAAAIYDASKNIEPEPYFFRNSYISSYQTNIPQSLSDIGERKLLDWLLQKYVVEFFYVIPDSYNIEIRSSKTLRSMSTPDVYQYWLDNIKPDLESMASRGVLREVKVFNEISKSPNSDYWQVDYELKTWYNPNDMSENPQTTRGTMYLNIYGYTGQIGPEEMSRVFTVLKDNLDPALAFSFKVRGIQIISEKN